MALLAYQDFKKLITQEYADLGTWNAVSKQHENENTGTLWKIVKKPNYRPGAVVSGRLGIQHKQEISVCPDCGIVHTKQCPHSKLSKKSNPRPRRISIHCTDMNSAARTIRKHITKLGKIQELLALLEGDHEVHDKGTQGDTGYRRTEHINGNK